MNKKDDNKMILTVYGKKCYETRKNWASPGALHRFELSEFSPTDSQWHKIYKTNDKHEMKVYMNAMGLRLKMMDYSTSPRKLRGFSHDAGASAIIEVVEG